MPFKALTPFLSVSPQLSEADVAQAARDGFRAIIDNRPDGEDPGQPTAEDMRALAASQGMGFAHVPTVGGAVADEHAAQMADALSRLEGPVLAYCRTGMRSTTLWALTQAGSEPTETLISTAAGAGYDLSPLRPRLDAPRNATTSAESERASVNVGPGLVEAGLTDAP
jgi:sulfide:quinone oxidoreductase